MKKPTMVISIAGAAIGLALASSAVAQANGGPQRSSDLPPGLAKALEKEAPGLIQALAVIDGSNSRLQDLPVSQ